MWRVAFPVALIVLLLDQVSKWWVRDILMQPPLPIEIAPFFSLVQAWNRGISFSLFRTGSVTGPWVLSAVAVIIVVGLAWWLRRARRVWPAIGAGLVMGGAIGNVVDRLRFGAVFDFLDLHAGLYHWPAFNLADSAITVGVAVLVIDGLFPRQETARR